MKYRATDATNYYKLFKINMDIGKYDEALKYIKDYQLYSNINCDIYINLLNRFLYNKLENLSYQDKILGYTMEYKPILDNYNLAIKEINIQDYEKAIKHIKVCIKLLKKNNIDLNLKYIIKILMNLDRLVKKQEIEKLRHEFVNTSNCGSSYLILLKLIKLDPHNIDILLFLVENSILLHNYQQASVFLHDLKSILFSNLKAITKVSFGNEYVINEDNFLDIILNLDNYFVYSKSEKEQKIVYLIKRVKYLENRIVSLEKSVKNGLQITLNVINIETIAQSGNLKSAVTKGIDLFQNYNNPFYLYSIGKMLYDKKYYKESQLFFSKYIEIDNSYLKEAYCYLFYINYIFDNNENVELYFSLIYELSSYAEQYFTRDDYFEQLILYIDKFSKASIIDIEKKLWIKNNEKNKLKIKK